MHLIYGANVMRGSINGVQALFKNIGKLYI